MKNFDVTVPEVAFVAVTRGMAGFGIGLLAADHLRSEQRRAVGWTLIAIGLLTTLPIAAMLFGRTHPRLPSD